MALSRQKSDRNILVIGKTGSGKSATCNTLLDTNDFVEGDGGLSETAECKLMRKYIYGRCLTAIDTPGTVDVSNPDAAMENLTSALDGCPEGVDAFLIVLRYDVRATEEELNAANDAVKCFGPKAFKRAIIVFTHCEKLNGDKRGFQEYLKNKLCPAIPKFRELLSKVGDRVTMLSNDKSAANFELRQQQINDLLELIDEVAQHNKKRFKKTDQETESDAQNQMVMISDALRQTQQLQVAQQSQIQQMQQMLMIKMMLEMHAREFGMAMEVQRMRMRETLEQELRNQRLEMQYQQRREIEVHVHERERERATALFYNRF